MTQRYLESCSYAAGRRAFLLKASALGAGLLLPVTGSAAQIKTLQGKVTVNGKPAAKGTAIKPGDKVATGPGAKLAFVLGQDAFLLRENSRLELQKAGSGGAAVVSGLRILTGALLAVFGKGNRDIRTATATIGIRGTGVYLESEPDASYVCVCYGTADLRSLDGGERHLVVSSYHTPNMIYARMQDGAMMQSAQFKNHTDDELIMLEGLVGRTSPVAARRPRAAQPAPEKNKPSAAEPMGKPDTAKAAPAEKPPAAAEAKSEPEDVKPEVSQPPATQAKTEASAAKPAASKPAGAQGKAKGSKATSPKPRPSTPAPEQPAKSVATEPGQPTAPSEQAAAPPATQPAGTPSSEPASAAAPTEATAEPAPEKPRPEWRISLPPPPASR